MRAIKMSMTPEEQRRLQKFFKDNYPNLQSPKWINRVDANTADRADEWADGGYEVKERILREAADEAVLEKIDAQRRRTARALIADRNKMTGGAK